MSVAGAWLASRFFVHVEISVAVGCRRAKSANWRLMNASVVLNGPATPVRDGQVLDVLPPFAGG